MDLDTYNLVCLPLQRIEAKIDILLEEKGHIIGDNKMPEKKEKITPYNEKE